MGIISKTQQYITFSVCGADEGTNNTHTHFISLFRKIEPPSVFHTSATEKGV